MGKNLTGGSKQKSKKNGVIKQKSVPINDITPDNTNRFIGKVTKPLGSFRVNVETYPTNDNHNALIPGSFRNRIWINTDDYVLIEISTEIGGINCYVVHKYDSNEIDELINLGFINIKSNNDSAVEFDDNKVVNKDTDDINIDDI